MALCIEKLNYKILSMHMKKREINILIYDSIYMWKTVQNHSAPLQYLNSFFQNRSSVQNLWPFHSVLEFISLNTVLKSFSHLVRHILINIFVVLWHLILIYFIFSKWLLMTFIFLYIFINLHFWEVSFFFLVSS